MWVGRPDESTEAGEPAAPPSPACEAAYFAASHEVLFEVPRARCAVCEAPVPAEDDSGYAPPGRGLMLWARGDERRVEEPPLCASCAAAIGLSALRQWDIEEEEG